MSETFDRVRGLVELGDWRASDHALHRVAEHAIIASDLVDGIGGAIVVEDYPDYHPGPAFWFSRMIEMALFTRCGDWRRVRIDPRF